MATLSDIARLLNVPVPADGASRAITGVNTLTDAAESELSFLGSEQYIDEFRTTKAAAVLVQSRVRLPSDVKRATLIVDDADLAVGKVLEMFAPPIPHPPIGIDASARVAKDVSLGADSAVGANAVIGARTRIGARCRIHPNVFIGEDVTLGDDCQVFPNVVVRERITIGNRVTINAGSVLGTDGFGYRWDGTKHAKIPQIGTVIVEDDVEIGSCVCIDRAKFSATLIGRGTKIDNLVQIAHNVRLGAHCVIIAQAGIAGSSVLGNGVVIGGQVAVKDHMTIGDGAMVAPCAGVMEDVEPKAIVSGVPAFPHRQSLREQAALRRLPELVQQVRKLQEQIARLEQEKK